MTRSNEALAMMARHDDAAGQAAMLHHLVERNAERDPQATAVIGRDETMSYGALESLSRRVARGLAELGVGHGDRVGLWLEKSPQSVAAMLGVLKLGAAYVPMNPSDPVTRVHDRLADCRVAALVCDRARGVSVRHGGLADLATLTTDEALPGGSAWADLAGRSDEAVEAADGAIEDLALILYTSGSTGQPKGICISHGNALAIADWVADEMAATPADVLSNHAPHSFSLHIIDIFGAFRAGAAVALIDKDLALAPARLVDFIRTRGITIWYSVPSALLLMMTAGGLLENRPDTLRLIMFAGEVFPIKHLRTLREAFPDMPMKHFFGPTETSVCAAYDVTGIPEGRIKPMPIGRATARMRIWAVRPDGSLAAPGEAGELMVEGAMVMIGYWGRAPQGDQPFATGDIVVQLADGNYEFIGRRDHQIKVRGHRVELGEVEAVLLHHPAISEAVATVIGEGAAAQIVALVVCPSDRPTLVALKQHCAHYLPRQMLINTLHVLADFPRTSSGKADRAALRDMAENRVK